MGTDYRLWGRIFGPTRASAESPPEESRPFTFQTAFTYAVGFGRNMDESEAGLWVQWSGRAR